MTEVTTTYLQMTSPDELRPSRSSRPGLVLARVDPPMPELNRFFYTAVGGDWYWFERLPWTYQHWWEYLNRPELETWVLSVDGVPAGYFELEMQADEDVEVVYFGLLQRYIGQGLGGHLITAAVERAWQRGAKRVWLHTCNMDHPSALPHYLARGFQVYQQEIKVEDLPLPLGPWPGAHANAGTASHGG